MKKATLFLLCFYALTASAQGYSDKVKLLGQHGIPYFYNDDIEANIKKWIANEHNATSDILGRSVMWSGEMEYAQKINRLPWFVKFIPAANTGYDNSFTAKDGSKGMWPLNYSIAKKYGLALNSLIDERRNVETSASAACRYLADLQYIYKDWLKTITAFRIGAIRLNQVIRLANNSLDFSEIYKFLEPEEREPIIQFYAAVTVMYFRHDLNLQETEFDKPVTDTVSLPLAMKFSFIEENSVVTSAELRNLNPQFISDMVPWFGSATIFKVPASKKSAFDARKDSMIILMRAKNKPVATQDTIVVVKDSVTYISIVTGVVEPDSVLIEKDTATRIWVWYTVKTGDGFYTLSDIFDCSIEEMKKWNDINSNTLVANTLIKFYVAAEKSEHYKKLTTLNHLQKREIALSD